MRGDTLRFVGAIAVVAAITLVGMDLGMDRLPPVVSDQLERVQWPSAPPTPSEDVDAASLDTATEQLEALTTRELGDVPGYDRDQFGQRWADIDRNGCDQRNDALRAAAIDLTTKPGTQGCVVMQAQISDPYTGETISFVKGEDQVDIDHVVPLSRAWDQGAADWTEERREEFANTPGNLLAVDSSQNRAKGDSGPEEWMPPAGGCSYVIQWIDVKSEFELAVSPEEKSSLEDELSTCERGA